MAKRSIPTYSTPTEWQADSLAGLSAFAAQDLAALRAQLDGINASAGNVSASLTKAFASASASGRAFNATLASITASLAQMLASVGAGFLNQGLSSIFGGLFGGVAGSAPVAPFADGGIVASPTYFGAGGSLGLMGERGAEAIMPLARGPNGQLGVIANGASGRVTQVTVNIQTPDVESFRRSEAQVAAALARAVSRGRRGL
ncbi:MAG: phage tail tape measure protein [Methylobacteriaceae bacterium]|nr:phage tail tape measure protein [Methylobacteriaceae bacterium]